MKISDSVANYILELLETDHGSAEIQRNELANILGCVPSQINYVITSRFTPEQGYIVESRRGGGGYIRITRITVDPKESIMHIVNSIGKTLDSATARARLTNMLQSGILDKKEARLIHAATANRTYASVPQEMRDTLRATVFKEMLMIILDSK